MSTHKQEVTAVFDLIAQGYDRPASRFFPFCADRLLSHIALQSGQKVLDVCTGTATAAVAAAQLVGPHGRVTGIDLSEAMLEQAQEKVRLLGLTNIDLHVMDGDALEFRNDYFDTVVCAFGLFFLPDMLAGLKQWYRVVKPGGLVAFSSFAPDAFQPMSDLFLQRVEALAGEPMLEDSPAKRLESADQCRSLLEQAGFVEVAVHLEQVAYRLRDAAEWWDIVWNTGYRGFLRHLDREVRERFRGEHLAEIAALATDEGISLNVPTWVSLGWRPRATS